MAGGRLGGGLHRTPIFEGFWKFGLVRHASWNDAADPLVFGLPATVPSHQHSSTVAYLLTCLLAYLLT